MRNTLLILLAILAIVVFPLLVVDSEFEGADAQAEAILAEGGHEPWFEPLWEPPGGETESLLFALQAALGAGLLGYYIGVRRGRSASREEPHLGGAPGNAGH
ncbi:energy-coupling factor ABC transporter substrate-binding protein [Telmatospirillum sp. J64-1]|uniref:energy-coupling factor ABC transporter substrate-binding protein n=1 Tax=Telmatospirillum sp. J64-1 TaxID=2502183 RepID=UPI00115E5121|nr:energy-coupling factor ABC transporter substrate-binding protein [Telmatospirillum sp. J64-1]